ncbi:EVE domain-containing protein [Pareuzebyella sediminis]|uniref:EVE domain-containing protein n=1 Tax=Pareuzebyella sediminis TaxID=2607998 RepID=UPI0011EF9C47|nr:EVE domain-containing protein [Pareuzebyella sediminis]
MKYYIIVASKDHVKKGVKEGFAQSDHGKKHHLIKLKKNDWVIYYSSKETYGVTKPFQKFTAIGQVKDEAPFQVKVSDGFEPWRRKIHFHPAQDVDIRPLLGDFSFVTNKKRWGFHFMKGFLEIPKADFDRIAEKMLVESKT